MEPEVAALPGASVETVPPEIGAGATVSGSAPTEVAVPSEGGAGATMPLDALADGAVLTEIGAGATVSGSAPTEVAVPSEGGAEATMPLDALADGAVPTESGADETVSGSVPTEGAVLPESPAGIAVPEYMGVPECPAAPELVPESVLNDPEMPLTDHLAELRRRIIVSLGCWALGCCILYGWAPQLLEAIRGLAGNDFVFVFTSPTEAFMAFVKLSMLGSFFFCLPIFIYHIVAFVCPGLTGRERKWMLRLVPFSLVLFGAGEVFAWYVALPIMWRFFLGFQSEGVRALWSIGDVVGFVVGTLLLCGVVFQTPLLLVFLAALELVSAATLSRARRGVYFGAFVASAIITPTPDAFTATVVALPLIVFFEISLVLIKLLRLGK